VSLLAGACATDATAPGLDGGSQSDVALGSDAGAAVDTGNSTDAGTRPPVSDAGAPPDSGQTPGTVDAGFVVNPPDPPEGDTCANVCANTDCQRECLIICRIGEDGMEGDARAGFLTCMDENPCDASACEPNEHVVLPECEEICRRRRDMDRCHVEFVDEVQPDVCGLVCTATVARMEPANAQAWLDCTINVCSERRRVDCRPELFLGPTPTQQCIDAGRRMSSCPGSDRHFFAEAWQCEGFRSPAEQGGLGGSGMAHCLANTNACGDWAMLECLTAAEEASGRARAIQELCAPVAACDDEAAYGCRLMAAGITPMLGARHVQMMAECIAAAGSDCGALRECAEFDQQESAVSDRCNSGCRGCGEGDWRRNCSQLCNWMERSMSVGTAERYTDCVGRNTCNLPHQLVACGREALPRVGGICQRFWQQAGIRCPEWRHLPAAMFEIACTLSGVRSGTISEAALDRCAARIGCESDPADICLKGRPN
jgi:hypothetical protein